MLVGISLIHKGCVNLTAIEHIQKVRPGSLNMIESNFLISYSKVSDQTYEQETDCTMSICQVCTIF